MKPSDTLIENLQHYSVRLNDVFIPVTSIESVLANSTQHLVAATDHNDFPVSLVGSCVAVNYRDRFLVLCTRHQLSDWSYERISLMIDDGRNAISSSGARFFEKNINDSDYHDLVAFNFTDPCAEIPRLRNLFFNLSTFPPDTSSDNVVGFIISGFPSAAQNYDLASERKLDVVKVIATCQLDGPRQPADEALLRLKPCRPIPFNPDGMSGGPAYVIQLINKQPHAYFAGIVVRANENYVYIVRSGFVRKFLESCVVPTITPIAYD